MEEPGGLQSTGSIRVGHDWVTSVSLFTFMHSGRKWQPAPVFLPGESQGRGGLLGCRLWGRTESDTTEATQQQQQQQQRLICYEVNQVCWSFSQSVHLILPTYSPTLSKKKKKQQNHQISYLVFAKPWSQFCFCFFNMPLPPLRSFPDHQHLHIIQRQVAHLLSDSPVFSPGIPTLSTFWRHIQDR